MSAVPLVQAFLDEFERLEATMPGYEHAWLRQLRRDRLDAFVASGLPARRDEAWRYTPLKGLEGRAFALPRGAERRLPVLPEAPWRLVFVDGRLAPEHCRDPGLPGIELLPLATALRQAEDGARFRLSRLMSSGEDALDHLNAALATDGFLLRVAAGAAPAHPLHLVFCGSADERGLAWHLRFLVELEPGARLRVVEHWRTAGDGAELATAVGQLQLGEDSALAWLRIQRLGSGSVALSRSTLQLERGSALELLALDRGGELVRGEWRAALRGREARCTVSGVARVTGARHLEHALEVRHLAPATAAEVRFRGVAEDRGRAVFTGTLYVAPGADGTETRLSSRNLLLSPQAEIDTRPVLEIHNDEVVAGHGATVGQLDPEALFYLRSRGLKEATARALLIDAFLGELLARVSDPELAAELVAELRPVGAALGSEDRE